MTTQPDAVKLLTCPVCQGEAVMQTYSSYFQPVCRKIPYCVEGRRANSYEDAAEIWNTRAKEKTYEPL